MADRDDKVTKNVAGKYYVDTACSFCESCIELAPENFAAYDEGQYAYVKKQPENETEEARCREALESCPEEAIGDDGG
jgi:ferredoxin